MTIKAFLFDMDGTLLDSEPFHFQAIKSVLKEELGITISDFELSDYIGLVYSEKLKIIFKKRGIKADCENISDLIVQKYKFLAKDGIPLVSGAEDLLLNLKKRKLKLGLVSATWRNIVEDSLRQAGVLDYFDIVIGGNDVEKRKPDPECYFLAAKKLGLDAKECVVVEDSIHGVEAGKRAGMFTIAVPNGYIEKGDFSKADLIVKSLKDIPIDKIIN